MTDFFHTVRAGQYSSTPQPVYTSPHINPPPVYQTPHPPELRLPPPEKCNREPGGCRPFLTQCRLIFSLQPSSFSTECTRVAYIITQLTGCAMKWGIAVWEANVPCTQTSGLFREEMTRVFDRSKHGHEAGREILRIHQGNRSVLDYPIDFQALASNSRLESRALYDAFICGLAERLKEELDGFISLTIQVHSRLEDWSRFTTARPPRSPASIPPPPCHDAPATRPRSWVEPMQVDRSKLTSVE